MPVILWFCATEIDTLHSLLYDTEMSRQLLIKQEMAHTETL